jgi:catechol 2,3-dioxygenase-like lactoylglutathione lyase family enzyme
VEGEMEFHVGRLIDHVHIRVADRDASRRFYGAVAEVLGLEVRESPALLIIDELVISDDKEPTRGLHIAFQTPDRETVDRFHEVALAAGGTDNGAPGERDYHPGYYAAFVLDPDGNNVEAVNHGPAKRSATDVVITPG